MFFHKVFFIVSFILLQILNFTPTINCNVNLPADTINNNVSHMKDYLMNEILLVHDTAHKEFTTERDYFMKKQQQNSVVTDGSDNNQINEEKIREKSKTFIDYFHDGVRAYTEKDWELCINHLERSLIMYHEYYNGITTCRIRCENERERYESKFLKSIYFKDKDQDFYEALIFKTLCLERCRMITLPNVPRYFMFFQSEKEIFKTRKPYEYLQICYYRDNEIQKAISATFTALVANPDNPVLKKNMKFYSELKQFDYNKLQDFEDNKFSGFYKSALSKYEKNEWEDAIELFEVALDVWLQELEKCRVFCEGEFNQGWLPDLTTAISNHYFYSLRCKTNCTNELTLLNGRYHENIFSDMYDYLQYAYYKNNNIKEASQCASSYLLLHPNAETMQKNIEFYRSLPNAADEYFQPRPETKKVFYRNLYEQDLLNFIDEEFIKLINEADPTAEKTLDAILIPKNKEKLNPVEDPIVDIIEKDEEKSESIKEQSTKVNTIKKDENKNEVSFGKFINDLFTRF